MTKSLLDCRLNLNAQISFTVFYRRAQSENDDLVDRFSQPF